MSKKKRKTRAEKATPKKYDFKMPVYRTSNKAEKSIEPTDKKKSNSKIDPKIIFDLKKVGLVITSMLVLIAVLYYLIYRTEVFNLITSRLGINY